MLCREIIDSAEALLKVENERDKLLSALRRAAVHAAAAHAFLTRSERINGGGGAVKFTELAYRPVRVLSVKREGRRVPFFSAEGGLELPVGGDEIRYCYCPDKLGEDDEMPLPLPCETIVLGTVAEYLTAGCRYDEGAMYMRRFDSALAAVSAGNSFVMPSMRCLP